MMKPQGTPSPAQWMKNLMPPPKVTLKAAATLDGKIATRTGQSQWITGAAARKMGHFLRSQHDAILVGINTVLADNPQLTTRGIPHGKSPLRIVLDSQCRISPESACLQDDGTRRLVVVGAESLPAKVQHLQKRSICVLQAPTPQPQIKWLLSELVHYNITHLLVEGGSQVHASFIRENLADHLVLFLAGKVIGGGDALSWCGNLDLSELNLAPRLKLQSMRLVGEDLMLCMDFIRKDYG